MVIQCSSCDTRFKISDDKVKSGPVKVRCSKCKEVFTVQPPEEEQAVVTEAAAVAPESNTDSSPSLDDVDWGSLNSEESEAPAPAADETSEDVSTDGFSFGEEEESAGTDDAFSFADSDDEPAQESTEFSFGDDEPETGSDSEEETADDFSFGDDDTAADEEEESADDSFSFGGSAETTADDFGFDEAVGEGAQDEFSFDETSAATGDADDFDWDGSGTDAASGFDETEDSDGSLDFSSLEMAEDEPAAVEVEVETQSVQVATPESRPTSVKGPQKSGAKGRKAGKRKKAKKKSGPLRSILILLLLLISIVGGSLFGIKQMGFWSGNIEELQDVDYVTAAKTAWELVMTEINQLAGTEIDNQSGTITITEMNGRYVQNATAGTLLVIEGNIRNDFKSSRTAIAVKGILYDQDLNIIRESKVYCGNAIDGKTLQTGTVAKMQEYTDNPFGDRFSNEDVAPGTSLPFTIIFNDIPENFSQFNVEIAESMVGS